MIDCIHSDLKKNRGEAWAKYSSHLSDQRRHKLEFVAQNRTKYIRLIVQDVHNSHNVSACLRSAEAFGILNVDVVHLQEKFIPTTVAKGVEKWLKISKYKSVHECINNIRKCGCKIAAAFPDQTAMPICDLPLDRPLALLFGNEHEGVHPAWASHIDYRFTIPMVGLVESLNISVSCAITLREVTERARTQLGKSRYFLSDLEKSELLDDWILEHIGVYG